MEDQPINKSNKTKFRSFTDKELGGIILTNPIVKESKELPELSSPEITMANTELPHLSTNG